MKFQVDRTISIATLLALLVAIGLMLRRPAPQPAQVRGDAAEAQSSNPQPGKARANQPEPGAQPVQPAAQSREASGNFSAPSASSAAVQRVQNSSAPQGAKSAPQINSNEISAAISQLLGASGAGLSPDSNVGSGMPNIKDQKVTYDGDTVHGQFLTEIGGKDVWITISGHMGQKDGYAVFDPTEFKVGDIDVPVSLVNPALQRKLAEERDRLKIAEPSK
jgi:hypothetical protein